jgi:DNA repair protein RecN (Recombination protein N)
VTKLERSGKAASQVDLLDGERRVQELARMLGGVKVTRATLDHAAEMLRNASRRR